MVSMPRGTTMAGQLAAMGFADTARAQRLLTEDLLLDTAGGDGGLLEALAGAADPDLALASLARLAGDGALLEGMRTDAGLRERMLSVLGTSAALGDHLVRHPDDWRVLSGTDPLVRSAAGDLRTALLTAVGAQPGDPEPVADPARAGRRDPGRAGSRDPATALRAAYRRCLLHLAA